MSLEPSFSENNVVRAELKCMVEIANVQGPGKNVLTAEMSLVPRSLEASSTVDSHSLHRSLMPSKQLKTL